LININQFITKNYFSRHQHSFFYSDEKVLDQTFYISSDFPSMVLGTDYGRIFIIQLFQDIEGRSFPVIVLDCHHSSPISCMYIAYSSARRNQSKPLEKSSSMSLAQSMSADSGGHLIVASEDGTISITNMNSGDIVSQLANFSITRNDREKKKVDEFMRQRE
jgi:WD40 repeat protein